MKYVESGPARISEPWRINLGLIRSGPESLDASIKLIASLTSWTDISISDMERSVVSRFGKWWLKSSIEDWEQKKEFSSVAVSSFVEASLSPSTFTSEILESSSHWKFGSNSYSDWFYILVSA